MAIITKKLTLNYKKPNQKLPSNSQKGITNVETKDNLNCSFMWNGPINDLNKLLATLDLKNLSIEEPDLEEVFLHYYKEDR